MKKIMSILLVVMLVAVQLLPIINVKAEEPLVITTYGENDKEINPNLVTNTAELRVSNIGNGDEFSAYKIIDVFYNKETNEMTYDFTTDFRNFLNQNEDYGQTFTIKRYFELTGDNLDGSANSSVITSSTLNVLLSKYATYIRNNDINSTEDLITNETQSVPYAGAEVVSGAYLILPSKVNTKYNTGNWGDGSKTDVIRNMYGVMIANVVFSSNNGNWYLNGETVNAKRVQNFFDTMLLDVTSKQYTDYINGIDIGDISITYQPNINSYINKGQAFIFESWSGFDFPTNAINKQATYTIEFPDGIDFDETRVFTLYDMGYPLNKIVDGKLIENDIEVGRISFDNKKVVIVMNPDSNVTVVFDIWLNDKAIVGDDGNVIKTSLTVTEDPYVENSTIDLTLENTIYTYGLEVTSLSSDDSMLLKGAKYEIYSKYTDSVLKNKIGEFTVGDDGKASFAGVPSGTIYLKQVKAPTGYQLIKEPIAVEIATEGATAGTKEGYYQVITYNDAMWYLPSTGGVGTVIYTLIGLVVIGISSVFVIKYKKSVKNSSLI